MTLPISIAEKIEGKDYIKEEIGRSGAEIWLFSDMVLKIEKTSESADREYKTLLWLDSKLPAPRPLVFKRENGMNYLLMTRLSGTMACEKGLDPETVVKALARGLLDLWSLDIARAPFVDHFEKEWEELCIFWKKGLGDVATRAELAALFAMKKPQGELVFSHGDYCLPNVFLDGERVMGYLDLGCAGVREKWYDIATCLWSLAYNFKELGDMDEDAFSRMRALFFAELRLEPDEDKLRFYDLFEEVRMKVGEAT